MALTQPQEREPQFDVAGIATGETAARMPADGFTVLVVEDEGLIRLTVAESLRDAGFAVTEASNGDGALALLNRDDTVALVISDIEMPGSIDGLGLAGWLRREMPHVVVVLVSGRRPDADMSKMADAFLEKPIDETLLVRKVRQLLGHPPNCAQSTGSEL